MFPILNNDCVFFSFFGVLECFHFILVPSYSSLQELSNGMFYKGISSTMTHIGPQRVTPLGAQFSCILYSMDFQIWICAK